MYFTLALGYDFYVNSDLSTKQSSICIYNFIANFCTLIWEDFAYRTCAGTTIFQNTTYCISFPGTLLSPCSFLSKLVQTLLQDSGVITLIHFLCGIDRLPIPGVANLCY